MATVTGPGAEAPLLPLRIAAGWLVSHNVFVEWRPDRVDSLTEDLLQLSSCRRGTAGGWEIDPAGFLIDVGWYPDGDPDGTFRVVVVSPDFRGEEILAVEHRDPDVVRDVIAACTSMLTSKVDRSSLIDEFQRLAGR